MYVFVYVYIYIYAYTSSKHNTSTNTNNNSFNTRVLLMLMLMLMLQVTAIALDEGGGASDDTFLIEATRVAKHTRHNQMIHGTVKFGREVGRGRGDALHAQCQKGVCIPS